MRNLTKKQWDEILLSEDVKNYLNELAKDGTLERVFPEVQAIVSFGDGKLHKRLWPHTKQVIVQCGDNLTLRWAALFHDIGKPSTFKVNRGHISFHGHEHLGGKMFAKAAKRTGLWKNDPEQMKNIKWVIANSGRADYHERWTDAAVRRFVRESGDRLDLALDFTLADQTTKKKEYRKRNRERIDHLRMRIRQMEEEERAKVRLPKGLGHAIIKELGAKGSQIGKFMDMLKSAVEQKDLENNRDIDYYMTHLKERV